MRPPASDQPIVIFVVFDQMKGWPVETHVFPKWVEAEKFLADEIRRTKEQWELEDLGEITQVGAVRQFKKPVVVQQDRQTGQVWRSMEMQTFKGSAVEPWWALYKGRPDGLE